MERQLFLAFNTQGPVSNVKIPRERGCGFVQFQYRQHAATAMYALQGLVLGGSAIRIAWGKTQLGSRSANAAAAAAGVYGAASAYRSGSLPGYGDSLGAESNGNQGPPHGGDPYTTLSAALSSSLSADGADSAGAGAAPGYGSANRAWAATHGNAGGHAMAAFPPNYFHAVPRNAPGSDQSVQNQPVASNAPAPASSQDGSSHDGTHVAGVEDASSASGPGLGGLSFNGQGQPVAPLW